MFVCIFFSAAKQRENGGKWNGFGYGRKGMEENMHGENEGE